MVYATANFPPWSGEGNFNWCLQKVNWILVTILEKIDKSSVSPACFCFELRQQTEKLGHDLPQRAWLDVPKSSSDLANCTVVTPRLNSCPCLSWFNSSLLSRCFKTVQALGVGLCSTAWLCTHTSEPFSHREGGFRTSGSTTCWPYTAALAAITKCSKTRQQPPPVRSHSG